MENSRYESGLAALNHIDGHAGQAVIDALQPVCPDLAKYIIEFGFGDIYQRTGLDLKTRELITVASLTALGHCEPQLNVHINGALNVGCTTEEITEAILQMSLYAGFPAAIKGMMTAKQIFQERDLI